MKMFSITPYKTSAAAFALSFLLAGVLAACSSGDKPDAEAEEELSVDDDAGLQGGLQGGEQSGKNSTSSEGNSQGTQESSDGNIAEEKTPISEDGYDDDWNNLNSQQQKANNNKNNKKNQVADDEPPLQNTDGFGQGQGQQTPPQQQTFEQPVVQQFSQIPEEEPPIDSEPAPVALNPEPLPEPVPEPAPEPTPEVSAPMAPVVSGAPLIKQDVEPVFALLHWVGYDYMERDSVVRIEIVTRGSPRYNLFQERNKADQPELVIRFFNTRLRSKVRRDIDASEFRSPVAYVRMRPDEIENSVDVIITMRDAIKPRMFSKYGNILLTFAIPDHYFGNAAIGSAPIAKAEVMANANIMPDLDEESEIPEGLKIAKAFVNNPGKDALGEVPNDAGQQVDTEALPVTNSVPVNSETMPADFSNTSEPINLGIPEQNTATNNFGSTNNFAENSNSENFTNSEDSEDFSNDSGQENSGNVQQEEFNDFQGEPANSNFQGSQGSQGANEFNFGGGQNTGAPAQSGNFSESELNGTSESGEFENTGEELDEDSLDNFENDSGSQEEIDKFDVRRGRGIMLPELLFAGFIVTQVSVNAVAQDDFDSEGFGNQQATQNAEQSDFSQGGNPELGNVASDGDIEDASFGGNQSQGENPGQGNFESNSGGNNFGNSNTGGNNFGNSNTGGNNFGNSNTGNTGDNFLSEGTEETSNFGNTGNANAFPDNSGGNVTNTTLSNGNTSNTGGFNATGNAAVNTGTNSVPVNNTGGTFSETSEPALEGTSDLAGPETEGSESEFSGESSGGGRKIKLDFREADLADVIRVLGEESGVNFVLAPGVGTRKVTINLSGVPFNDALKALLSSQSLGMVEIGPQVVKIDTLQNIAEEKTAIEQRRRAEMLSRPTKILVHRLSYAVAAAAAQSIQPMLQAASGGDTRVNVQTDTRSNAVIVNAVPELLSVAKTLLERLDLETPQIRIASRIVEVLKNTSEAFGVSWGTPFNYDQGRGLGFGNLTFPNYMMSRYTVDAGGTTPASGNAQFRFGSINNTMALDLALSMEESKGTTEILQSNDVTVEDNTPAFINAGGEETFAPLTSRAEPIIVDYSLSLGVTPHVTADGAVQMDLNIQAAEPTAPQSTRSLASRNVKEIRTKLMKRSGETAVIGGVYTSKNSNTVSGVPFLSKIPIIGALFRSKINEEDKRELLIMVTPTILNSSGKSYQNAEPESVSLNAGNNANFNTQLNNSNNFNSQNQENSNFDSNSDSNTNSQGNFNSNGGNQSNNLNSSGNQQTNSQQSNNQQSANQQSNNQQSANQQSNDDQFDSEQSEDSEIE